MKSSETDFDQPVIAEATSSADVSIIRVSPEHDYENEYANEIVNNMSNESVSSKWFHPHEHDYLKNDVEPEPSGLNEQFENYKNDIEECTADGICPVFHKSATSSKTITSVGNCRINNYDTELPQEIFNKPENFQASFQMSSPSVLVNIHHHQDSAPLVVRQVIEPPVTRYNTTVILQDEQSETQSYHKDRYMIEEAELEGTKPYMGKEIQMNVAKNVKLLAFPSNVKYNEKYIIEEVSIIQLSFNTST